jgi:hypothetical protein
VRQQLRPMLVVASLSKIRARRLRRQLGHDFLHQTTTSVRGFQRGFHLSLRRQRVEPHSASSIQRSCLGGLVAGSGAWRHDTTVNAGHLCCPCLLCLSGACPMPQTRSHFSEPLCTGPPRLHPLSGSASQIMCAASSLVLFSSRQITRLSLPSCNATSPRGGRRLGRTTI